MKYYKNFFSQLRINTTTSMSKTSTFFCYVIIISYFIIFCNNLLHIQHLLIDLKLLLFSTDMTRFLSKFFFICLQCSFSLRIASINLLNTFFSLYRTTGLLNLSSIHTLFKQVLFARNKFLILFGIRSIIIIIITLNFF